MGIGMLASQALHLAAALVFGYLVFLGYRDIRRRSTVLGATVALAILIRIFLGVSLFSISYLELPLARSLQLPGGFWTLAIDATGYFQYAAHAVDTQAMAPFDGSIPSPFYVNALAFWMLLVGVSPVAGAFFNLCLYIAFAVVTIRLFHPVDDWRRDLPCIVGLGAYSFSPAILFSSTQPIKDELSCALVAMACFGVLALRGLTGRSSAVEPPWRAVGGTAMICCTIWAMGGMRWYFGVIIWCALAVLLAVFAWRHLGARMPRYLFGCALVLVTTWLACWVGAERSMRQLAPAPTRLGGVPAELLNLTQMARNGFLKSGGSTNVVIPINDDPQAGQAAIDRVAEAHRLGAAYSELDRELRSLPASSLARGTRTASSATPHSDEYLDGQRPSAMAIPVTGADHIKTLAIGVAMLLVPTPLIEATLGITLELSRGLISLVTLDTLFLDASILAVLVLLWQRRGLIGDRLPIVVFGLILSITTAFLIGYVVTNFGTLWRMRSLVAIPLWVAIVALSPRCNGLGDQPDNGSIQPSTA